MEKKRKDTRPLTVNGELWEYKIGRKCIAIHQSDGKRHFPRIIEMVGKSAYENRSYQLNPAFILNYIKVKILNEKGVHNRCSCCGKVAKDVSLTCNPFNAEIYDDYSNHYYCQRCVVEISWDI